MKAGTARPVNQQENELTVLLYLLYCKYKEKLLGERKLRVPCMRLTLMT